MQASHSASSRHAVSERLRAWVGSRRPDFEGMGQASPAALPSAVVKVSARARDSQAAITEAKEATDAADNDPRLSLIKAMVEMLTGRKINTVSTADVGADVKPVDVPDPNQAQVRQNAGWGVEYDRRESVDETEQTRFSAQGVIKTTDGKEISFSLNLTMARAYREETGVSLRAGDARKKDPLVLNFGGTAAQLADSRFRFDLNSDGKAENVPLLSGGSGYLAIDRNGDGKITSGTELFGPQTGNGYQELARLDADGNGWIDQNDAAYDKLRVWTPDAGGAGTLATLKERNVGALYLGSLATPFELRTAGNDSLGSVRSSGIYLCEDGKAGTMQQVDLTA